ncbi:hypothetical protein O0L34_g10074 [Tuta absoluta]|nr:hypothetical protein O0L34_g10074 [Tuta absoluta]
MAPGRRAGEDVDKPVVIHDYNKFMGDVDVKDQKLSGYLLERKRGIKWYIKVFRRLLNVSILNSYIIYCANIGQQKKMTHRQFRVVLVEEICARFGASNITVRPQREGNPEARLDKSVDHYPEQKEVTQERTSKQVRFQRGRCVRCAARKQRSHTNLLCSHCKVFLCIPYISHNFDHL